MDIEKPIPAIRKAIQNFAEEKATGESLETPEAKHFEEAFKAYKKMRAVDPEGLKLSIEVRARDQKIKNSMGKELYKIFDQVWIEINKSSEKEIRKAIDEIRNNKKILNEEKEQAIDEFELRYIKENARKVKNDPRIISAFSGKEEILREGIFGVMLSMLHVLRSNREDI